MEFSPEMARGTARRTGGSSSIGVPEDSYRPWSIFEHAADRHGNGLNVESPVARLREREQVELA